MTLESLISRGRIIDIMVVFVLLEIITLVVYWRKTGRGIPTLPLLVNIGAGGSLMLALGASLSAKTAMVIALCLVFSLVFHVADLALLWRR